MKKQSLNNLSLNKKTISSLKILSNIKGGWTDWPETAKYCPITSKPDPTPFSDPALCTGGWGECPVI